MLYELRKIDIICHAVIDCGRHIGRFFVNFVTIVKRISVGTAVGSVAVSGARIVSVCQ